MLAHELRDRYPELEVVFHCHMTPEGRLDRVRHVKEIVAQMRDLATAKACVVDGYSIPVSILDHRQELFVLQMWHALGAIKKFSFQSLDKPGGRPSALARSMRMHHNYDAVLCGSPAMVPVFAEAFAVEPEIVRPLGLPRVDYLISGGNDPRAPWGPTRRAKLLERFPRLSDPGKLNLLYAPTYRDGSERWMREMVAAVDPERCNLIAKPHDLERREVSAGHVIDATGFNAADLLLAADAVVTDYSAIAFEACVADKPLYFYVPDIDEYERAYGLNLDPLEMVPQAASRDVGELLARVYAGEGGREASRFFRETYISLPENSCTDAIADLIADHL